MKITSIECLVLDAEYPYAVVHTDEGITGFGECFRRAPYVSKAAIETVFAPLLIGRDPFDTAAIWDDMFRAGNVAGPPGALQTAASGIDIALWDIKGKALDAPIYSLLGGKRKDKIRVYASSLQRDLQPDVEARRVAEFAEKGFTAYKMHSAIPENIDDSADLTIQNVKAIRKLVGDDIEIMVDVNGAYSVHHAIEVGKALQDLGVFHFEEPVHVEDLAGLAQVADALDMPIAAGENAFTRWEYRELVEQGQPDIVQPDVVKCGGISEFQEIVSVVSSFGRPMTIHNTQPYGSTAAHLHLIAGRNDFPYAQEYNIEHVGIRDAGSILKEPFEVEDGFIRVPDGPGLGLEYDLEVMRSRDRQP